MQESCVIVELWRDVWFKSSIHLNKFHATHYYDKVFSKLILFTVLKCGFYDTSFKLLQIPHAFPFSYKSIKNTLSVLIIYETLFSYHYKDPYMYCYKQFFQYFGSKNTIVLYCRINYEITFLTWQYYLC